MVSVLCKADVRHTAASFIHSDSQEGATVGLRDVYNQNEYSFIINTVMCNVSINNCYSCRL